MCSASSGPGSERVPGCRISGVSIDRAAQPIPAWVRWVAQDSTGAWWGYSVEPLRHDGGWYENETGRYVPLGAGDPPDWMHSLRAVCLPFGVSAAVLLRDSGEIRYGEHLC